MLQVAVLLAWGALSSPAAAFVKRVSVEESWKPAVETADPRLDNEQLAVGWSPRPTDAPELKGRYAGMLFQRADDNTLGSDTCGFDATGNSYTCITNGETCTFSNSAVGCCDPSSTCDYVKTTCIDYEGVQSGDCDFPDDFHTLCCKTSYSGSCFTWYISTADTTYSILGCDAYGETSTLLAYNPLSGDPSSTTEESSSSTTDDSSSSSSASTDTSDADDDDDDDHKHKKSSTPIGAIVGGVVGGVAVIVLIAIGIFFILRKNKKNKQPPTQQQQPQVAQVNNPPPNQGPPSNGQIPPSPQSFAPTSPSGTAYPSGVPPSYQGYQQGGPQPYDPHASAYGQPPFSPQSGYSTYSPPPASQYQGPYPPPQQGFDQQNGQYNQYGAVGFQPPSSTSPPPNLTPSPGPKESEATSGHQQQQQQQQNNHHHHSSADAQELPAVNPLGNENNRAELG